MDLLDILRVVRKRWKVASIAGGCGFVLLLLASIAVEPDWDGTAIVVVDPPSSIITTDELGNEVVENLNPILRGSDAAEAVPRIAVVATSQETRTTFSRAGLSTAYDLIYFDRQPYLTLKVTDGDPDQVIATLDALIDLLNSEVQQIQDGSNVPDDARAVVNVLAETEIAANQTNVRRVQGVILVLTIVAAVSAATLTDSFFRNRDSAAHFEKYGPDQSDPSDDETAGSDQSGDDPDPAEKPNRWQRGKATEEKSPATTSS